jgi:hypothetical protein
MANHGFPARGARKADFRRVNSSRRRGAITVLSAVLMVVVLLAVAFAVDVGMICVAKTELQRSADAAALAAPNELLSQMRQSPGNPARVVRSASPIVRSVAASTAGLNSVFRASPAVDLNSSNREAGEIIIGKMVRQAGGTAVVSFADPSEFNSVQVRVERSAGQNGNLPLFFGRLTGLNGVAASAQSQAAFLQSFKGFRVPSGGSDPPPTLMFLPFAVEQSAWENATRGIGPDDFGWEGDNKAVRGEGDGVADIHLYPLDTGAGGNFGTVDIGSNNSNTPKLRQQIVEGVTSQDLDFHGGALVLDNSGQLILSGDPGLKVGPVQKALRQIIGQPRIIPLYSSVSGNGQKAEFTVIGFGGCRVLHVQLTGSDKRLVIQPAAMITRGGIPGDNGSSSHIYSPVILVN